MKPVITTLLLLMLGTIAANSATMTWTNTGGGNWSVAANWSPNQVPGSSDNAIITASGTYTVTFNASATIAGLTLGGASGTQIFSLGGNTLTLNGLATINSNGQFNLAGATLAGTNAVIAGVLTWTSGTIPIGSTLTIATNGMLIWAGTADSYSFYGALTNAGTVLLTNGDWKWWSCYANPVQFINSPGALLDIKADVSIVDPCGGGLLVNYATVRKSGGTGTSTINAILNMNSTGTLDVQTGTVSIAGGGSGNGVFQADAGATSQFNGNYTVNSGAQFIGAGTNLLVG